MIPVFMLFFLGKTSILSSFESLLSLSLSVFRVCVKLLLSVLTLLLAIYPGLCNCVLVCIVELRINPKKKPCYYFNLGNTVMHTYNVTTTGQEDCDGDEARWMMI